MCSIFGFVARERKSEIALPLQTIAKVITDNVRRGPHAFGLAWVTADGRLRAYRQAGKLTQHMHVLRWAEADKAVMLIGHMRYATHGSPDNNINNHPHPIDGGWLVHNGVVHNYNALLREHELDPVSECDSEIFGLLADQWSGPIAGRMGKAIAATNGPAALMGLWSRPARMIVARRDNPLHLSDQKGYKLFATLGGELPGTVWEVKNNSAFEFTYGAKGALKVDSRALPAEAKAKAHSLWSEEDEGEYRGG